MNALEIEVEQEKASASTMGLNQQHLLTSFNWEDPEASVSLRPDPRRWEMGDGGWHGG